jgi:hypothetical protein
MVLFHGLMLSGPDTPGFLFLGGCEANHLQSSYSQHQTLQTENLLHLSLLMFSVECGRKGNEIPLRYLQRHTNGAHIKHQ